MHAQKFLRFGNCEVHAHQREVWLDGQLQPVAPRVFELLLYLMQQRHRVVQKRELLEELWQRQDVSDSVLARNVMQARKAIGDSASQPICIKTVHRYGYRFVAEVFESDPAASPLPPVPSAAAVAGPRRLRVGLLPCLNQTGDVALDWVQLGLIALVGHALDADARLEVVPVSTMLEVVARLPADAPPQERSQLALQSLGLKWVVQSAIRRQSHALWLDYQIHGVGEASISGSLRDAEAVMMGERLARAINFDLFPGQGRSVEFESRDPFVNQAFARAIELYACMQIESALRMMAVVCDMEPRSTVAQLWHLRLRTLAGDSTVLRAGEALLEQGRASGDVRLQATTHVVLGHAIAQAEGPVEAARAHMEQALRLAEGEGQQDWVNVIHVNLAQAAWQHGEPELALQLFRRAEAGFKGRGNSLYIGLIEHNLAAMAWEEDDPLRAKQGFEDALITLRRTRRDALAMHTLARLGEVNASFGLFHLAESQCNEALAAIPQLQSPPAAAAIVCHAAGVLAGRGALTGVDRALERAIGLEADTRSCVRGPLMVARAWRDLLRGDRGELRRRALEAAGKKGLDRAILPTLLILWLRAEDAAEDADGMAMARRCMSEMVLPGAALPLRACLLLSAATERRLRGDVSGAINALNEVINGRPFGQLHSHARLNTAWLHLELGLLDRAEQLLRGAGAWRTEHAAGLAAEARLRYAQGAYADALALQRRSLSTFNGPPPRAHEQLLQLYAAAAAGRPLQALPQLRRLSCESWLPEMRT